MLFLYIFTFCTLKLSEVLNISAIFFKQGLLLALFPEQTGYNKREKEMRPKAASDIYAIITPVYKRKLMKYAFQETFVFR